MPNFIIILNYQKSELKKKYQKRDYSNELVSSEMVKDITMTNDTSAKYDILHKYITNIIDKHAPLRYLNKNEIAIKAKPWLTGGLLKYIQIKTKYYKKYMQTNDQQWFDMYKLAKTHITITFLINLKVIAKKSGMELIK